MGRKSRSRQAKKKENQWSRVDLPSPPQFNGTNFAMWTSRMRVYLRYVDTHVELNDEAKNALALHLIQLAVDDRLMQMITAVKTSKEAWCILEEECSERGSSHKETAVVMVQVEAEKKLEVSVSQTEHKKFEMSESHIAVKHVDVVEVEEEAAIVAAENGESATQEVAGQPVKAECEEENELMQSMPMRAEIFPNSLDVCECAGIESKNQSTIAKEQEHAVKRHFNEDLKFIEEWLAKPKHDVDCDEDLKKKELTTPHADEDDCGKKGEQEEDSKDEKAEEDSKDEKLYLDDNEPEHYVEVHEEQEDEIEEKKGDVEEGDEEDAQGEDEEAEGQDGKGDEEESEAEEAEDVENEGQVGDGEDEEHQINDIPAPLKDRRKQKEFEIFVGGLDKEADEEDLKKVFGVVGEIKEVRMSKNPATQKNRGFAFIRYETIEAAKRALTELKDAHVRDKRCGVSPSQDNDTLYLGNICKTWTKDAVREKLNEYGIENLEEMALMDDPKNEGQNRGYAFLEFSTHQCAMQAYKRLQKRDVVLGCERTAKVAFAESSIQPDEELMAQVKSVFLDGLPASWDDERVKEELKKYGEIEKVQLSKNMSSAKRKDYGFVHFSTREEAQACVDALKSSEIGDGDSKVKANIAKPQNKSRLVKQGVRGGYRIGEVKSEGGKGRKRNRGRNDRGRNDRGRNDRNRGRGLKNDKKKEKSIALPEKQQADPKRATKNDNGQKKKRDRDTGFKKSNFRDQNRSRGSSRNDTRRFSYPDDRYSRHLERVHSYLDAPSRPYSGVSGSKRPYAALDDVPRFAEPALRHPRARLDYDVSAGAPLYGGAAYGRLGRAPEAGYSSHSRTDLIGQQSYGLYDGHQAGSLGGAAVGGIYSPPGYGTSSLPARTDVGGSSYSSLYASRRSSGDYLLGRGSRPYY